MDTGRWSRPLTVVVCALTVVGCTTAFTGNDVRSELPQQQAPAGDVRGVGGVTAALGGDVLGGLTEEDPSANVAVAPTTLLTQLAMLRAGAAGATAAAIDGVVGRTLDGDALTAVGALETRLASRSGTQQAARRRGSVEVDQAVALWVQRGTYVTTTYLDTLATTLGTGVRQVDIRSNPEAARSAMNLWTANASGGRIDEVVPAATLSPQMRLVSTGAVWLSAPWLRAFDPEATREAPFTTGDGQTRSVPTMRVVATSGASYGSGETWQAVELPYLGRDLAMVVVTPTEGTDAGGLVPDAGLVGEVLGSLRPRGVTVRLPRFGFTTRADLGPVLARLAGTDLADPNLADFSLLAPGEPLAAGAVIQQVPIGADENGTDAGRITTAGRSTPTPRLPTVEVVVDRPFLVLVVDRPTGAVVVAARVADPAN